MFYRDGQEEMRYLTLLIMLIFVGFTANATHNRGGEITYKHISGNTYEITLTTCTFKDAPADREEIPGFDWGDGSVDTLYRDSYIDILHPTNPDYHSRKNFYKATHTYAGPGTYRLCVQDPNRNASIENIANSVNVIFAVHAEIVISPFFGHNNSVDLLECPCPEIACVNNPYCYNVAANDIDGDSLSYELIPPYGDACSPLTLGLSYVYPDAAVNSGTITGGGGNMTINPVTGTLCWDSPTIQGEFNFVIKISEWRNGKFMGYVIRDIQLFVENCTNNAPVLDPLTDTCIMAGDNLNFAFDFNDPNTGDIVTLTAYGEPFLLANNAANFAQTGGGTSGTGNFSWNTTCDHVRSAAYPVYFTATDDGTPVQLTDIETMFITVNAPPVQNLVVNPLGNGMTISWSPHNCNNITGYRIYRRAGNSTFSEDCCSQNAPQQMGYSLIGQTSGINDTTFYDNSGDLIYGTDYCYIVTAVIGNNTISCVSAEVCNHLIFDVPAITNVSVVETNSLTGKDSIIWAMPKELDTTSQWNDTYYYKLYRGAGFNGASNLIYTTPSSHFLATTDTMYFDNIGINTEVNANNYFVELYHIETSTDDTTLIGSSSNASSVFLTLTPNDNEIGLSWAYSVPWTNYLAEIYKETSPGVFTFLDTTSNNFYVDTGLVNGSTYCYKVKTIGTFNSTGIYDPLENWSQETCAAPIDLTPPCPPTLTVEDDCDNGNNLLRWNNPNNSCADDVTSYNVYYAETDTSEFFLVANFNNAADTSFNHDFNGSIAGCYYVTALDSIQYNNESLPSDTVCIDNCPYYWMPNVFTPNGDNINELLTPIDYKYVEDVDAKIFNRWGTLVFETTDKDLNWDGTEQTTSQIVSEGVYFYIITVNTIRLNGIVPIVVKGSITIIK